MSFPLRFHPEADLDVWNATLWYEEQRLGLGTEFLDQLSFLCRMNRKHAVSISCD